MMTSFADLAWWFGFSPSELMGLTIPELNDWVKQMNRQIKAKEYVKGFRLLG
ncbi:MAG: GpE family phage tail protein [Wohlfahrtiimonas sp.]